MAWGGVDVKVKFSTFVAAGDPNCQNVMVALTPAARMILSIVQMQFIFLNTKEFEMKAHKVVVRFGLMHMLATNLCEWLYVLVEETKHEIFHLANEHLLSGKSTHPHISLSQLNQFPHFSSRTYRNDRSQCIQHRFTCNCQTCIGHSHCRRVSPYEHHGLFSTKRFAIPIPVHH